MRRDLNGFTKSVNIENGSINFSRCRLSHVIASKIAVKGHRQINALVGLVIF